MKYYELSYLISPKLSEEELRDIQGKINSFIQEEGGFLNKIQSPAKKKLAYPIKKQSEAFFVFLDFYLLPEKLALLKNKLKAVNQILRYLIFIKKVAKAVEITKKPPRVSLKISKKPSKVELAEIEKKLEEILNL